MRTFKKDDLNNILEQHRIWLIDRSKGSCAHLNNADLRGADLRGADLNNADLRGADLRGANLTGANLRGADLSNAVLAYADLSDVVLRYANLTGANLRGADLSNAVLAYADLSDVVLRYANLTGANLIGADLNNTNLYKTVGNSVEIRTVQSARYHINITKYKIQIGCKSYSKKEWFAFSDGAIKEMDAGALEWWTVYKPIIKALIDADEG
jgi:uncharacterized protein YjbI with pentapeptide repeats